MLRYQGRVLAGSGDPADISAVLAGYKLAFNIIKDNGNNFVAKMTLLHDWVIVEALKGDCMKVGDLLSKYVDVLNHQNVFVSYMNLYKQDSYNKLVHQKRCQIRLDELKS